MPSTSWRSPRISCRVTQRTSRWLRIGALIAAAGSLAALCDSFYVVSGRVDACDTRKPIADARIRLDVPELDRRGEGTTDDAGAFRIGVNHPPARSSAELTIEKPGYVSTRSVVRDPDAKQRVCLEPAR